MSEISFVSAAGSTRSRELPRLRSDAAWRWLAYAASVLFTVGWTLALGKDVHWDAVNYHLYLGFSALNDRFALDFFGAGTPSYLNPYAYVPLYLMSRAGLPAVWLAIVFAAFHAVILWLTYEIALVAGLRDEHLAPREFALLAVVLAITNPLLLHGIGSTFVDISTGVLVVGGWLALARAVRFGGLKGVGLAGALCGAAAALKLSNAVFAVAGVALLPFLAGSLAGRVRAVVVYGAAGAAAFAIVALPWGWQLWREFGNPFFPFLNHWFASPDFTEVPLRYERFVPASWQEFLTRPFELLSARSTVHAEPRAPDLRYAALLLVIAAWSARAAWCALVRQYGTTVPMPNASGSDPADATASRRVLLGLLAGLALAWCLWLAMSGNSRYFVPMACVASVVLALVLQRLYAAWRNATIVLILVFLTMQVIQIAVGSDWRREGYAWEGPWLGVEIPERFRHEPHLYLSVAFFSGSAFVPYLHPDSGMINISGFNVIGPGKPGGARAQALIDRNIDRVRLLIPLPNGFAAGDPLPGPPENLKIYTRRFGLLVDGTDCDFFKIEANLRGTLKRGEWSPRVPWTYFVTCRLIAAPEEGRAYLREVAEVDTVFDRVEDACPNLFHPRRPVTQQMPFWVRTYNMGSEIQLSIENGKVKYFLPLRGGDAIEIGTVQDWQDGPQPIDCSRRTAPAFGGMFE